MVYIYININIYLSIKFATIVRSIDFFLFENGLSFQAELELETFIYHFIELYSFVSICDF